MIHIYNVWAASGGEREDGADEPKHSVGADQRGGHQAGRLGVLLARHASVCHGGDQD